MWTIFNPTDNDLTYIYRYLHYRLNAGETKKFADEVGENLVNTYGFLEVLKKDEQKPKKTYEPPKNLDKVEEAEPLRVEVEDRREKHPTSDPKIMARSNFLPTDQPEGYSDSKVGLGLSQKLQGGKLVQIDKDGVEWYGSGVKEDNPFAIDKEDE